jgi:pimeloyl-ACP methyl ester carboxylesterase
MMQTTSPSGAISALQAMAGRASSADTLGSLKVPALVVVGSEDVITPLRDAERMQEMIPDAELLVLEGCGHLSLLEKPAEFNAAFERFLKKVAGRTEGSR